MAYNVTYLAQSLIYFYSGAEREGGRGCSTRSLRALSVHLFVTLAVECCQCHMASQGSFNWFRAETVTSINHCVHLQGALPSGDLCVILNGAQLNIEVRATGVRGASHGQLFGIVYIPVWFREICRCMDI